MKLNYKKILCNVLVVALISTSLQIQPQIKIQAASPSHIHTNACYSGHRHGTYEVGGAWSPKNCAGKHEHCSNCFTIDFAKPSCGGTLLYSGSMNTAGYYFMHCNRCNASENWNMSVGNDNYKVTSAVIPGYLDSIYVPFEFIYPDIPNTTVGEVLHGKLIHRKGMLTKTCNKISDDYYEDNCNLTEDKTLDCNTVVTSISATAPTIQFQGEALNQSGIVVTANYLDGHSAIVTNYGNDLDSSSIGTKNVTITYSGLVDDAKTTGSKTVTIQVNVIPKTTSCNYGRGHADYELNQDATDPGCLICFAINHQIGIAENNKNKLSNAVTSLIASIAPINEFIDYLISSKEKIQVSDSALLDSYLKDANEVKEDILIKSMEGDSYRKDAADRIMKLSSSAVTTENDAIQLANLIQADVDTLNSYINDFNGKMIDFETEKSEIESLIKKSDTMKEINQSADTMKVDFGNLESLYHKNIKEYDFDQILHDLENLDEVAIRSERAELGDKISTIRNLKNSNISLETEITEKLRQFKDNISTVDQKIKNTSINTFLEAITLQREMDAIKSENQSLIGSIEVLMSKEEENYHNAEDVEKWAMDKNYAKQRDDIQKLSDGLDSYNQKADKKYWEIFVVSQKGQEVYQDFCKVIQKVESLLLSGVLEEEKQYFIQKLEELKTNKSKLNEEIIEIENSTKQADSSKNKIEVMAEEIRSKVEFAQITLSKQDVVQSVEEVFIFKKVIMRELDSMEATAISASGSSVQFDNFIKENEKIIEEVNNAKKNYEEEQERMETIGKFKDILEKLHDLALKIEDKKDAFKDEIAEISKDTEKAKEAWEKDKGNDKLSEVYEKAKGKSDRLEELFDNLMDAYDKVQEILKKAGELVSDEKVYDTYEKAKEVLNELEEMLNQAKDLVDLVNGSYASMDTILHPPIVGDNTSNNENISSENNGSSVKSVNVATFLQSQNTIKNEVVTEQIKIPSNPINSYIGDKSLVAKEEYLITKELGLNADYKRVIDFKKTDSFKKYTWYAYKIVTGEIMECSIQNLTVDYVQPKIAIQSSNKSIVKNPNVKNTYQITSKKPLTFKIKADYGISGKYNLQYQFVNYGKALNKDANWKSVKNNIVVLKNNNKGRLYIKATDKAGNEKIVKTVGFKVQMNKEKR